MSITLEPQDRIITSRERLRLSAIYFFTYFGAAAMVPYLALYYSSVMGFTGAEIGALLAVSPLLSIVTTPFWSGLADSRRVHLRVLLLGLTALAVIYALIPFLDTFPAIMLATVMLALLASPVATLQDSAAMHMLGRQRAQYGRVRLWGTVGWGLGAPLFGLVLVSFGLVWMFWIYSLIMFCNLLVTRGLVFDHQTQSAPLLLGVRELLRTPRWLLFFLVTFLASMGMSANSGFMSLLLEQMSVNNPLLLGFAIPISALVGIVLLVSTVFELPVMFFSGPLLTRFGTRGLLLVSLLAISLRNFLYALAQTPDQVLAIQVLHGLTFAAMWMAGVNFVAQNAPRGLGATAQGLFNTVTFGLGWAAGNFISGVLLDWVGVKSMFAFTGGLVFVGLLLVRGLDRRFKVFG